MGHRQILLVEDNEDNRDMLGRRLSRQGYAVCYAVDGPSGVHLAQAELPDVILMDIALGEMDGWEATRLIKDNPRTAAIPVIALTAHALAADAPAASRSAAPITTPNQSICRACWARSPPASVARRGRYEGSGDANNYSRRCSCDGPTFNGAPSDRCAGEPAR